MIDYPIEKLFSPTSRDEFLAHYKNNETLVVHNFSELPDFLDQPLLSSIDSLFDHWPTVASVYKEGTPDEVNSETIQGERAADFFFKQKRGVFLDRCERFSPLIDNYLRSIHDDLGLSKLTVSRGLIYAISKGEGTAAHFDQNINIIIQIVGEKKWWVAPNEQVINPTVRHTIGHEIPPELSNYVNPEKLRSFPKNAKEYTLAPGSVMFLPRGAWHKTIAIEDSLSLNFTYNSPTWSDLFIAALEGQLKLSEEWRESVNFVNDPEHYPETIEKFEKLLAELSSNSKQWKARDIIGASEIGQD